MSRQRGDAAESAVVKFLELRGYTIVARNFACRWGEIDIIATMGRTLCFVEVRMKSSSVWGDPSQTVTFSKQRKIVKTALYYLARHPAAAQMLRFDVVAVIGGGESPQIDHLPNAFEAGM